jgi:hypothetical protein
MNSEGAGEKLESYVGKFKVKTGPPLAGVNEWKKVYECIH